jgi:hypothetical protein
VEKYYEIAEKFNRKKWKDDKGAKEELEEYQKIEQNNAKR